MILFYLFLFFAYLSWIYFYYSIKNNNWSLNLEILTSFIYGSGFFIGAVFCKSNSEYISNNLKITRKLLDDWVWKQGRKQVILLALSFSLFAFAQLLPGPNAYHQLRYFVALCFLSYAVYFGIVLLILWNPKYFLQTELTSFGSGTLMMAFSLFPARLAALFDMSPIIYWGYIVFPTFIFLLLMLIKLSRKLGLNFVQETVLSIVYPDKLLVALRTHYQLFEDQYKAARIHRKLESELSPGVLQELIKLIVIQYNPKNKTLWWLIGLLTPIIFFALSSVGESLIQDFLYSPIIKPILCDWFNSICN